MVIAEVIAAVLGQSNCPNSLAADSSFHLGVAVQHDTQRVSPSLPFSIDTILIPRAHGDGRCRTTLRSIDETSALS